MFKKLLAGVITALLIVTLLPQSFTKSEVKAAVTLQNPRIVTDSSMTAGQKVTYDCVWFGSYPQTEIVDQASTSGVYGKPWAQSSDYEENPSLYTSLKNATGWDSNGDVTLSGIKYRRIKSGDATYSESSSDYYYGWSSSNTYHYFRYEPIKWRVLNVDSSGNQVLLLADKALDDQRYNTTSINTTWKTSTIRSWLNGYGSSTNTVGADFTGKNFINCAFTSSERGAIESTYLNNKISGPYSENYGGDNTSDKVFLLSSYDVYDSDDSAFYGFYKADFSKYDEARRRRSSTYTKAMGVYSITAADYLGHCFWWLRSPGNSAVYAAIVNPYGYVFSSSFSISDYDDGVCPALNLNLSSSNLYSYAGTVCTDGTVHEEGGGVTPTTYTITYNANGGTETPASQTKTKGTSLTLTSDKPTRTGYTFIGWGTSSSSTNVAYKAGATYTSDANITLYAIWEKSITLNYNANGGSGGPSSQTGKMYNSDTGYSFTISSDTPTRNGYTFLGWSNSSSATSASYSGGNTLLVSSDTTLYAVWQAISTGYTVAYNANGGDGAPSAQTKTAGTALTLSTVKPTRNGYTFVGWATESNSTNISYNPGNSYTTDADLILYAIWKKIITLTYNANGGSGIPSEQSAAVYNATENYTFTISNISPSRTGYFFRGWGLSSNAESAAYMNGESITISADTMLYAVWEKDSQSGGESESEDKPVTKKTQTITAANKSIAINSKPVSLGAKTNGNGKLTYSSSAPSVATISSSGAITPKNYGTATITIKTAETTTFKAAIKKITVTVVPKKMTLTSAKSPAKKTLLIKWKKDPVATKYEIQLCMKSDFKKNTLSRTYGKKVVKQKIKNMKSKTWYVRIRAWKKIGGKTYYGVWSSVKKVKVK